MFPLGKSSEERLDETTPPENKDHDVLDSQLTLTKEDNLTLRPPSNMSSSSGNSEESLTTFADSTLRTLAANEPSLDISCLPAPVQFSQPELHGVSPIKASESETLRPDEAESRHTAVKVLPTCPMRALGKHHSPERGTILRQMRVRWKTYMIALGSRDYQTGQPLALLI